MKFRSRLIFTADPNSEACFLVRVLLSSLGWAGRMGRLKLIPEDNQTDVRLGDLRFRDSKKERRDQKGQMGNERKKEGRKELSYFHFLRMEEEEMKRQKERVVRSIAKA